MEYTHLNSQIERTVTLKGIDPKYRDIPNFVIGISKEIWEERCISKMRSYYSPDLVVRSPTGILRGNEALVSQTLANCHEFPDRQLFAEDVMWSGDKRRYLSSHRLMTTATHSNHGQFGKATGRRFQIHTIADCAASANMIDDEWLVRDYGGIVRQLGKNPRSFARNQIKREGGSEKAVRPFVPEDDVTGPYIGTGNNNEWGQVYVNSLMRIMNGDVNHILKDWDRAVQGNYSGNHYAIGCDAVVKFWVALRAAFPSAKFKIHHQIGMEEDMRPPRAAVRWSLEGKHDGWGAFGRPTGAWVHVMGMSHAEFGPWGLRREWALYDEVAIWKQILLHDGSCCQTSSTGFQNEQGS